MNHAGGALFNLFSERKRKKRRKKKKEKGEREKGKRKGKEA